MINLSKHFTLSEFIKSPTATRLGIDNTPGPDEFRNLQALVDNVLEPLRVHYGRPIIITSGYRCPQLNKAVGGSSTSQHAHGQAADIRSISDKRDDNKELFDMIREMGLPYDQLINEFNYDWIHVSFSPRNRRQVLEAVKNTSGKTVYKKIL